MNKKSNEQGFVTMLLLMIVIIGVIVVFAYLRVKSNQDF